MANEAMGASLRQLRDLFRGGTVTGLTDRQLLERYAGSRDGLAFEALVARHGPMVVATCRAILRQEQDVEDAFQATFLVLARKAGTVRVGGSLGGWLHRVAYRVALQARGQRKRRREREAEAMESSETLADGTATATGLDFDLRALLHEEIDRLPESQRLAVVLCDLEGLTYEQAAFRLHCTVAAFSHRLAKGRQRLRDRLIRRGLTASAVGVALTTARASAAVPALWMRSVVSAATGGGTTLAVVALSRTIIKGMLMTQLKLAGTATLAALILGSVGVLATGAARSEKPPAAPTASAAPAVGESPPSDSEDPAEAMIEIRGRVVDPEGNPVPNASVWMAYYESTAERAPRTTSGPDGRFRFRVSRSPRSDAMLNGYDEYPWVAATAPGFGPGWISGAFKPSAGERTIRLVKDDLPIEGRIVDLEGRPVPDAQIKVQRLFAAEGEDLTPWLAEAVDRGVQYPGEGLIALPILPMMLATATTGPDGRFQLDGIGQDRIVELLVSGPTIATSQIYAMSRDGSAAQTTNQQGVMSKRITYHARRFQYAVAPSKPVQGIIRDKDTGQPIGGVTLKAAVFDPNSLIFAPGVEATADAQGRYRLSGLPKAPAYRLFVEPGEGQPYPKVTFRASADSPAFEPVTFDITLKRGILIRGRVTDKATGEPVGGYVNAYTFRDNPAIKDFPGYTLNNVAYAHIKDDGQYEIVGLPGRNLIACRSAMRHYRGSIGADAIKGYDPDSMIFPNTFPLTCYVRNYHVIAKIDVDPEDETATLDLQVDPGRTLTIQVIDPEGRPVGGTKATGITDLFSSSIEYEQESPTVEVHALDPSKPRRVTVTQADRKLIGSIFLKGDEAGPLTLKLQPWGTITGRVIDEDGQPRAGLSLTSSGGTYPKHPEVQGVLPDPVPSGILIGSDGRFRVDGLVPGLQYGANATKDFRVLGDLFRDVTVKPGEVKDLGDLQVVPLNRGDQ